MGATLNAGLYNGCGLLQSICGKVGEGEGGMKMHISDGSETERASSAAHALPQLCSIPLVGRDRKIGNGMHHGSVSVGGCRLEVVGAAEMVW